MAKMMKTQEWEITATEVEASYRISQAIATNLQALIEAHENGTNFNGETPYAVYKVEQIDNKWIAFFNVNVAFFNEYPEDELPTLAEVEEYAYSMMLADMATAGFYN